MTMTINPTTLDRVPLHHSLPAIAVHTALRRELRLAGPLVRRAEVGDVARARRVARHLDFLLRGLRHHHELEDELVMPRVRARACDDDRRLVDVMHAQHHAIDRLIASISRTLPIWPTQASAGARNRLADLLEALYGLLVEHLDLEERCVLPLAELYLTADEWSEIGRRAEAGHPRHELALSFGMIQYEADAEVLASMLAPAPLPVRLLVPLLARRAYRRHAIAIHGTPTP